MMPTLAPRLAGFADPVEPDAAWACWFHAVPSFGTAAYCWAVEALYGVEALCTVGAFWPKAEAPGAAIGGA